MTFTSISSASKISLVKRLPTWVTSEGSRGVILSVFGVGYLAERRDDKTGATKTRRDRPVGTVSAKGMGCHTRADLHCRDTNLVGRTRGTRAMNSWWSSRYARRILQEVIEMVGTPPSSFALRIAEARGSILQMTESIQFRWSFGISSISAPQSFECGFHMNLVE
jgi:hypothetical protein